RRHVRRFEALVRHHMAPVAGGVADREQDRPVGAPGLGQRLLAPRPPMHRVVGVLQQVGAGLGAEAVHAGSSPRLPSLLINRTREWRSSFNALKAASSVQTRASPAMPAQPDGPDAIAASPSSGWPSSRRAGRTWSSSMVM